MSPAPSLSRYLQVRNQSVNRIPCAHVPSQLLRTLHRLTPTSSHETPVRPQISVLLLCGEVHTRDTSGRRQIATRQKETETPSWLERSKKKFNKANEAPRQRVNRLLVLSTHPLTVAGIRDAAPLHHPIGSAGAAVIVGILLVQLDDDRLPIIV